MLFQYKTLRKVYNQYFLLMQSQIQAKKNDETFKIVKINENEFKNPYLHPYKPGREHLWNESSDYNFLTYEQTCESTLAAHFSNGFFSAFFYAYNSHGDVKITPDDVWLTIMLYFSNYVNDHAKQLRKAFVSHQGKKELIVITENELLQTQWDQFFDLMIQAIKKNTSNEVTDKFQCNFTTTGRIQKILSTAAVMNIFKHYFQYTRYIVECGIHQVHFGGTLQDWQKIRQKTKDLQDFDVDGKLKTYIAKLIPILDLFVETYKGNPNVQHWNQILDEKRGFQGSGSTSQFTGWLTHFFGIYEPTEQVNIGTIGVDFKIDNKITNVIKNVKLVGGFRAVNLSGESKRVFRPHLSLAILDKKHH